MAKPIIQTKSVLAADLLNLIGQDYLQTLSDELGADKWVIKLQTKTVFGLLIYSLLENNRVSLRSMQESYSSALFKAIENLAADAKTAHSSIRDRLTQVNVTYFERIYQRVYQLVSQHYDQSALTKYNLKRYDSTMIRVFGHLTAGMKVGNSSKNKYQVKLTTELENDFGVRMKFFNDQPHLWEETALKELIQQAQHATDDLIVFDRGLKSRQTFQAFTHQHTQFVTRLNDNACYQVLHPHTPLPTIEHGDIEVLGDEIVYLYGDGKKLVEEEFRLVCVQVKASGQTLLFLTNVLDLSAYTIAYIYRQRCGSPPGQIETFFRFMKQEMNLTHFVSHHQNAIQVMLYCTLIAAMLILVYKEQNGLTSYKRAKIQFFKELQASIILEVLNLPNGAELLRNYFAHQAGKT